MARRAPIAPPYCLKSLTSRVYGTTVGRGRGSDCSLLKGSSHGPTSHTFSPSCCKSIRTHCVHRVQKGILVYVHDIHSGNRQTLAGCGETWKIRREKESVCVLKDGVKGSSHSQGLQLTYGNKINV